MGGGGGRVEVWRQFAGIYAGSYSRDRVGVGCCSFPVKEAERQSV